jgi:AcrR family transcriptional regulator
MRDISDASGVNKPLIYYHFGSKDTASAYNCAAWVVWRDGDRFDILVLVATIS